MLFCSDPRRVRRFHPLKLRLPDSLLAQSNHSPPVDRDQTPLVPIGPPGLSSSPKMKCLRGTYPIKSRHVAIHTLSSISGISISLFSHFAWIMYNVIDRPTNHNSHARSIGTYANSAFSLLFGVGFGKLTDVNYLSTPFSRLRAFPTVFSLMLISPIRLLSFFIANHTFFFSSF